MKINQSVWLSLVVLGIGFLWPFSSPAKEGLARDEVEAIVDKKLEGTKKGKISGAVFGDFAWFARYHAVTGSTATWEKKTAFWLRRVYFTYDHTFDEQFSGRFQLEANSGDLDDKADLVLPPFLKVASLKWKPNSHAINLGLIPTPTWGLVENHWGYRAVEKTPLDLQGFGGAVDLGVGAEGSLQDGKFGYAVMVGNGSGTKFEVNSDKKFYGAATFRPVKDLAIQAYGDYESGAGNTDRFNLQGFAGYTAEKWRLGTLFAYRNVQLAAGGNQTVKLVSGHGAFQIAKRLWGLARVDHLFDPNPNGNTIQYLPMVETSKPTFALAGLDLEVRKSIHLMPNVETIFYSAVGGVTPRTDIVPRLTASWNF